MILFCRGIQLRYNLRAQGQHGCGVIVGGVAMRQIPGHSRQVSHLRISNHVSGIPQNGIFGANHRGRFQFCFARQPANLQKAAFFLDIRQPGDAVDVDQITWASDPKLHHGDQALSATENLRVLSVPLQEGNRFRNCVGSQVFEGWWDHCLTSSSEMQSVAPSGKYGKWSNPKNDRTEKAISTLPHGGCFHKIRQRPKREPGKTRGGPTGQSKAQSNAA